MSPNLMEKKTRIGSTHYSFGGFRPLGTPVKGMHSAMQTVGEKFLNQQEGKRKNILATNRPPSNLCKLARLESRPRRTGTPIRLPLEGRQVKGGGEPPRQKHGGGSPAPKKTGTICEGAVGKKIEKTDPDFRKKKKDRKRGGRSEENNGSAISPPTRRLGV